MLLHNVFMYLLQLFFNSLYTHTERYVTSVTSLEMNSTHHETVAATFLNNHIYYLKIDSTTETHHTFFERKKIEKYRKVKHVGVKSEK